MNKKISRNPHLFCFSGDVEGVCSGCFGGGFLVGSFSVFCFLAFSDFIFAPFSFLRSFFTACRELFSFFYPFSFCIPLDETFFIGVASAIGG
jgi:hypothetical protein